MDTSSIIAGQMEPLELGLHHCPGLRSLNTPSETMSFLSRQEHGSSSHESPSQTELPQAALYIPKLYLRSGTDEDQRAWVATREQVKTFLQIEDSSYDALIDTYLPIVSKDIKDITNNLFVVDTTGDVTSGSAIVGNIDVTMIDFGNVFIAEGLERVSVLTINDETITVSANSSVTGTEVDVKINVFPNQQKACCSCYGHVQHKTIHRGY
jgi:hypothetical protein